MGRGWEGVGEGLGRGWGGLGFLRGLLGTDPPDPTLESASPSPPQPHKSQRFNSQYGLHDLRPLDKRSAGASILLTLQPERS